MKLHCVSLGCPKNNIDLEIVLGSFGSAIELVDHPTDADVIFINTCAFILPAKEESIETILQLAQYKKENSKIKLLVAGCLPQRYREEIAKEMPEVDAFFFNSDVDKTVQQISSFLQTAIVKQERFRLTPNHYAYLRIADGCDNRCNYCAIPVIKGDYCSRPMDEIISEAQALAADGAVEIIVVAQDTTAYGHDVGKNRSLHLLLQALDQINSLQWIRLLYTHPAHWYPALIETVAGLEKVVKYIDLPIQHIANPILQRMGRKTDRRKISQLIETLRKQIPQLALRTSLIVGFPGETEKEFSELLAFVEETRFERLGIFTYSPEETTAAAAWQDAVTEIEKQARLEEIMSVQADVSLANNQRLIDRVVDVIIDEYDPISGQSLGRTQWDAPEIDNAVYIEHKIASGCILPVRISAAEIFELRGIICD